MGTFVSGMMIGAAIGFFVAALLGASDEGE